MRKSRGLRVVLYEPSGRGGVCHYTYELAEHLAKAGAEVTLMTTEDYELASLERHFALDYLFQRSWLTRLRKRSAGPGAKSEAPSPSAAPPRRGRPPLLRRLRIRLLHLRAALGFLRRRPDIVHFQWLVDRLQDRDFIRLLGRLGIPAIYTAHDIQPHLTASAADRAELRGLYDAVAEIIVHAENNKRELISVFGVAPAKIAVIPHGSYDFLCAREPLSKQAARERIGLPPGRKVILFFGLIKRYKGLEYLVEAFEQVRARLADAFLLIVGDIFAGDAESHRYYAGLIDGLRGRNDVRCVASYVPVESVNQYLSAADVVVLPYTQTYQSGVLFAAYAAGRPVVVTDTGGLGEVVEDGASGYVVPPENAAALAEGIVKVLSDADRLDAMGRRARHLATAVYGWDAVAAKTLDLYRAALGQATA